jgi:hypothetical protein
MPQLHGAIGQNARRCQCVAVICQGQDMTNKLLQAAQAAQQITADQVFKAIEPVEPEPTISTEHGPWVESNHPGEEGETYCKRCRLRDKFLGKRQCDPHIVYSDKAANE